MTTKRDYGFDNLKFILIFLVVFGHFLELCTFPGDEFIYKLIYLFHIPCLIFISGYFAKFNKKKIFFSHIPLYIIFQTLYIVFEQTAYKPQTILQFTKPYWILWYLFVLIAYLVLIPIYNVKSTRSRILVLVLAVISGLIAGFVKQIGYFFSLSRFFVFQPFFLFGFYLRQDETKIKEKLPFKAKKFIQIIILALCAISVFLIFDEKITSHILYGAYPYKNFSDFFLRLKLYCSGTSFVLLFYYILKPNLKKHIPLVSTIGKNTLPVFILHGFVLRMGRYNIVDFSDNPILIIIYSFLILIAFGNNHTAKLFSCLLPETWINKIKEKKYDFKL